jgi:acetolactate synthase-1/2/3 large subunit
MKLSDYVVDFLVKQNVKKVFGITGGSIIHVFESIGKNKDIDYICTQHEQAAAMAADAYSRITKNLGVALATSGPGATNLITGVAGSYYDSIPTLIITGQVPINKLKKESGVRQIGFQETDVVSIFKPITKYAVLIDNPQKIRYELEKAVHIAKSGRPGPVLLDVPNDIQRAEINPGELEPYSPKISLKNDILEEQIKECILLIKQAKRPIFILGSGIKLGGAEEKIREFIGKLKFPFVLTWGALDLFESENPLNAGCFGVTSSRPGNFAVQNSDLVIALGTKLDTHHTGTPTNTFAREAKKIMVDIDRSEIEKFKRYAVKIDIQINEDISNFLDAINKWEGYLETQDISRWVNKINEWKMKYPSVIPEYFNQKDKVNPYIFIDFLSKYLNEKEIIITDTGANLAQTMEGYKSKKGQRLFSSFNNSPMGYALPASIGACFANEKKQVICIIGDGGMQMNIQELATIVKHNLPIKVFVFNNSGYGMIKQTQDDWLNSSYEASCIEKGIAIPDFIRIGEAYGLQTERISNHQELEEKIKQVLNNSAGTLCEINISEKQRILPMLKSGRPIEDPKPLLKRKEFMENMFIKPVEQSLKEVD